MDPELQALFARLNSEEEPLTDEELATLDEQVIELASSIDPQTATDEDLEVLAEAATWSQSVREVQMARASAAEDRRRRAAEMLAAIIPPAADEPEETPAAEETVEVPAAETPAEDEPVVEEPEPVAASAHSQVAVPAMPAPTPPGARLPSISRLAARAPQRTRPRGLRSVLPAAPSLTAAADLPGLHAGQSVDAETWARACMRRYDALVRMDNSGGPQGERVYFGSVKLDYPEERFLTDDDVENEAKIAAVTAPQALAASGGICAPVAADYNLSTIAQARRPVRDALATFGATRGGVRYVLPHTLAQVTADGPASIWTQTNDVNLNSPATKPHATFVCQGVHEDYVDAVTSIVQFGNFQARYFPEQIQQYLDTVDAVHSRLAEATLLKAITDGSTAVTHVGGALGAARELLGAIDLAQAGYRYRHRMDPAAKLHVIMPEWIEDMLRTDLARQLPGDSGSGIERLATADAEIARFFDVRDINVSFTFDSPTGASPLQGWPAQNAGQMNPWPRSTTIWMFHEGAWMVLDGGELNLGMVRDSILNRTNDYQMFAETFEKAVFRGHESQAITITMGPTGASSCCEDVTPYFLGGS